MSQKKPARLYLDPKRRRWVIRYRNSFKRTPFLEHQRADAQRYLANVLNRDPSLKRLFTRPRDHDAVRPRTFGLIYFISKRGCSKYPIKIGFSASQFKRRLVDIQIGNPEPLEVLCQHEGFLSDEQALHVILADDRKLGEWFNRSDNVMEALAEARAGRLGTWLTEKWDLVIRYYETQGHIPGTEFWPKSVPITRQPFEISKPAAFQATKPPLEG
jgi:hypothetical protein